MDRYNKTHSYFLLIVLFLIGVLPVKAVQHDWKTQSVLSSGKWVKIKTGQKGIYKIAFSTLKEWGFSNPAQVNVYGGGGAHLSENPGEITYDDLKKNAVWHDKINNEDYLFFYAQGTVEWQLEGDGFTHKLHDYTLGDSFFYLSDVAGSIKNVEQEEQITSAAKHTVTDFDERLLFEEEKNNLIHSGKLWVGDRMIVGSKKTVEYNLINPISDVAVKINAFARSSTKTQMEVLSGNDKLGTISFDSLKKSIYSNYANQEEIVLTHPNLTQNKIEIEYKIAEGSDEQAEAWLNFVEIHYKRQLKLADEPLFFRSVSTVGADNITQFTLENASSSTKLLDVSDVNNVKLITPQISGSQAIFKIETSVLRELVAFNSNVNFLEPEKVSDVANQNLHGLPTPEFLIVTHSQFEPQAQKLADFHKNHDKMEVKVVTTEQVYNEFSSGIKDATAIRNFIKMLYDKSTAIKYVLLFGDGSFDNKGIDEKNKSFIPTFQSEQSLITTKSFVSDDYFVILDDNENIKDGKIDLGIGRIPATNNYDAEVVVEKVINYHQPKSLGNWRNTVCFIADDEDRNQYLEASELFANKINANHKAYITDKIYFDAFKQQTTGGIETYPDVTLAINKRVKEGVLILNYVGHANPRYMADEHVLDINNINSWSNRYQLPIFMTATCEFSRFDTYGQSAGESVLFAPNGGGIGLFSTTRLVVSIYNEELNREFYNCVFEKDSDGNNYRMGDIFRITKNKTSKGVNKRNFTLLADPALRLSYPEHKVITTTINGENITEKADTLGVLQKVTISGYIANAKGEKLSDFNGEIMPTVYDKPVKITTLGNNGERKATYQMLENIIYKGLTNVANGNFSFSFVVPKDISYTVGRGKIVYYAHNGITDANGAFENFFIGGSKGGNLTDNKGPEIKLHIDSKAFANGGETSKNPVLLAEISDENGINTSGSGIGHDITAVVDNDYTNVYVLNKFYQTEKGDYTKGSLSYTLNNLAVGKHTLTLKAWDVANNSSEQTIEFIVSDGFKITRVSNAPNPLTNETYFSFEHTEAESILKTVIQIYDVQGRRVDVLKQSVGSNGNRSNLIRWERHKGGKVVRPGIYFYQIAAENSSGEIDIKSGKMIILK